MIPAEVVFDRAVRRVRKQYKGKQDFQKLPDGLRLLLCDLHRHINETYSTQRTQVVASDYTGLYFDFIESNFVNALAFSAEGFALIGVTTGFISGVNTMLYGLCHDDGFIGAIKLARTDEQFSINLFSVLFSILLQFVSDHELGHHVHGHVRAADDDQGLLAREEFLTVAASVDNLPRHAAEIEADGYAVHMLLHNLMKGEPRQTLARLVARTESDGDFETTILRLVLAAVIGFFHTEPQKQFNSVSVRYLSHPPHLIRINYIIWEIQAWCSKHRPHLAKWPNLKEFQSLGHAVSSALGTGDGTMTWEGQDQFATSTAGEKYRNRLNGERLRLREKMQSFTWKIKPNP